MTDPFTVRVDSLQETALLAAALSLHVCPGMVICLEGQLGAGKTAFVSALGDALGVDAEVRSPTFTLENRYPLRPVAAGGPELLVHSDLYRPGEDARRDLLLSLLEARDEGALIAIEWADPVKDWLTPYLLLTIELAEGTQARRFTLDTVPDGWPAMQELARAWSAIGDEGEDA
ncbi:tRNA (adenosine(37)-N6)-threonylcarbamoyltransferase complex ATPase subunit type 1 TsaE [bacterium]|nr:MAG: tRNA (adenosine(37)-N6)-threonylcarbamoyltransferase complex ATPase subunit type 1 TsaE [bacterium]